MFTNVQVFTALMFTNVQVLVTLMFTGWWSARNWGSTQESSTPQSATLPIFPLSCPAKVSQQFGQRQQYQYQHCHNFQSALMHFFPFFSAWIFVKIYFVKNIIIANTSLFFLLTPNSFFDNLDCQISAITTIRTLTMSPVSSYLRPYKVPRAFLLILDDFPLRVFFKIWF